MPSPFPGMNPYLEHPELFPGFHHWLIIEIARLISPLLRPKYRVAVEVRMYEINTTNSLIIGIPDISVINRKSNTQPIQANTAVADPVSQPQRVKIPMPVSIREGYLEIREVETDILVTTVEILSPTNKRGKGRQQYEEKRGQILATRTNLVEIDLLRSGKPMPLAEDAISTHYRILICRGDNRPYADLYAFNVQDIIPSFPLPLRSTDTEPMINLYTLLNYIYDISGYDLVINYNKQPIPNLIKENAVWADTLLRRQGLR